MRRMHSDNLILKKWESVDGEIIIDPSELFSDKPNRLKIIFKSQIGSSPEFKVGFEGQTLTKASFFDDILIFNRVGVQLQIEFYDYVGEKATFTSGSPSSQLLLEYKSYTNESFTVYLIG